MIEDDRGEIQKIEPENSKSQITVFAQINDYTQKPEIILDILEEKSPGFIKKISEITFENAVKDQNFQNEFAKYQAWAALIISIITPLLIFALMFYLTSTNNIGFFTIIALAIFYAVTQGGSKGFYLLIEKLGAFIENNYKNKNKSPEA